MTAAKIIKIGRATAITSLITGTGLFSLYYLSNSAALAILSFFILIGIGLVNLIVLAILIVKLSDKQHRSGSIKTIGLILLNIPIALLYFYWVLVLVNTVRLTISNDTSSLITNVRIYGCEEKQIEQIEPDESTTIWINIPNDCAMMMDYTQNGKKHSESVYSYLTNLNGQVATYRIGTDTVAIDDRF